MNDYNRGLLGIRTGGAYNGAGLSDGGHNSYSPPSTNSYIQSKTSSTTPSRTIEDSYLFVDEWFEALPKRIKYFLISTGAFIGLGVSQHLGFVKWELVGGMVAGAVAGAAVIPIIIFLIKFVFAILGVAVELTVLGLVFCWDLLRLSVFLVN